MQEFLKPGKFANLKIIAIEFYMIYMRRLQEKMCDRKVKKNVYEILPAICTDCKYNLHEKARK